MWDRYLYHGSVRSYFDGVRISSIDGAPGQRHRGGVRLLVVLSACDTGLGTVQNGEGVYGLRRALVLAGAQSQLVSLWNVADSPTQELMLDYYQRLLKGEGRSAALRAAQLGMLANAAHQHPYYWAGFIPIGGWTPLNPGR